MLSLFAWPAADVPAAYAEDGGIYRVGSGVLSFNGGTIDNNRALLSSDANGNAVGGNGGGVYLGSSGFTLLSGEVSGNTADTNGGGFYVAPSAVFNLNGGTISGNTATLGPGVYADGTATEAYPVVINPADGVVITTTTSDYIFLNGPGTRISLIPTLTATNVPVQIRVRVSDPGTTRVVVNAHDSTIATNSVGRFRRWNSSIGVLTASDIYILYNGTTLDE
jgi:hypothetical protein